MYLYLTKIIMEMMSNYYPSWKQHFVVWHFGFLPLKWEKWFSLFQPTEFQKKIRRANICSKCSSNFVLVSKTWLCKIGRSRSAGSFAAGELQRTEVLQLHLNKSIFTVPLLSCLSCFMLKSFHWLSQEKHLSRRNFSTQSKWMLTD